jgi:riboflavin kinase/FMN adenylyltransferase
MRVEEELKGLIPHCETVLTVGVFDGVHLGHQRLLDYVKRQAMLGHLIPGVVTFRSHPLLTISPESPISYLTSLGEKIKLIQGLGVELVVPLSFDHELAGLSARQFLAFLQKYLKMRGLVVGPDFALGRNREGDVVALHDLGKEVGVWVEVVQPEVIDGEVVSSTSIRQALADGDISKVNRLLGRGFALSGKVAHGRERGKQLGFPTANLAVGSGQAVPADGVYATKAQIGGRIYGSVTNIGKRPTFGPGERTVEVYLIGFDGVAYEEELRIDFIERLRAEQRFDTPEELKAQINDDVEKALSILDKVAR